MACRLIALDKYPGIRPGICETLQHIIGKTVLIAVKHDIQDAVGQFSYMLVMKVDVRQDNHQPSQASYVTTQVVLNASIAHLAATQYVPSELR